MAAKNLRFSAKMNSMPSVVETPAPRFLPILSGCFLEGVSYRNHRTHGTQDWLLILTLSGEGLYRWKEGELKTHQNDLTLYRPGAFQNYCTSPSASHWKLVWAHFLPRPHWHALLNWPVAAPGLGCLSLDPREEETARVRECLFRMERAAKQTLAHGEEFAMNALEEALLLCDLQNPLASLPRLDGRIRRAMDFLSCRFAKPVNFQEAAEHCGLSLSRFGHLFREQTGETPGQFVERQRVEHARQLLAFTSRSIASIAGEVGYESAFYFSNRFRKQVGCSPREYRTKLHAKPFPDAPRDSHEPA